MEAMTMRTEKAKTLPQTSVASLVGQDIQGRRAIITQPQHFEMFDRNNDSIKVRTLVRAEYKQEKDGRWLRILWLPESGDFGCGYSGWREDYKGTPVVIFTDFLYSPEPTPNVIPNIADEV